MIADDIVITILRYGSDDVMKNMLCISKRFNRFVHEYCNIGITVHIDKENVFDKNNDNNQQITVMLKPLSSYKRFIVEYDSYNFDHSNFLKYVSSKAEYIKFHTRYGVGVIERYESSNTFHEYLMRVLSEKFDMLKYLIVDDNFSENVDNLPKSLKYLKLGKCFNRSVDKLPSGLTYLKIEGDFCGKSIDNLPASLKCLDINGFLFDGCVDNLPVGLRFLSIRGGFKQPVDNLPANLHTLVLGGILGQHINKLPVNLHTLVLDTFFGEDMQNLPNNLHCLVIGECLGEKISTMPKNLEQLHIDCLDNIKKFPQKLVKLECEYDCYDGDVYDGHSDENFINKSNKIIKKLPKSLRHVKFGDYYNGPLDYLPNGIITLALGKKFNQSINNLPDSITHMLLGNKNYNKEITKLPKSLEMILAKRKFARALKNNANINKNIKIVAL